MSSGHILRSISRLVPFIFSLNCLNLISFGVAPTDLAFKINWRQINLISPALAEEPNSARGGLPLGCQGVCNPQDFLFDEDNDGVSNCVERGQQTDSCDAGSFIPRLQPAACVGANGFLGQVNIATILNQLSGPLTATAEYRDFAGVKLGGVAFTLSAKTKRDLIINDLGLKPDTYGTLCVFTDAQETGAWSGGITLYKPRIDDTPYQGLTRPQAFDFALYYPFENAKSDKSSAPLNVNSIGTGGVGIVANWLRLIDALPNNGRGLSGVLRYYNAAGAVVNTDFVNIPDGGRFDYPAHDRLGKGQVGLAQFTPDDLRAEYYFESTRYFYEGTGTQSRNFHTAFAIPNRPLTGASVTGKAASFSNERSLSVLEIINGSAAPVSATLRRFDSTGNQVENSTIPIPAKGTLHRVVASAQAGASDNASAEISGPVESLAPTTVIYAFGAEGQLLYGYAPTFSESAGTEQFTEFNSFIGHQNSLEIYNSTDASISGVVRVLSYDNKNLFSAPFQLLSRASGRTTLALPHDTYGTIVVDAAATGLIIRNDVVSPAQYVIPLSGR